MFTTRFQVRVKFSNFYFIYNCTIFNHISISTFDYLYMNKTMKKKEKIAYQGPNNMSDVVCALFGRRHLPYLSLSHISQSTNLYMQ